MPKDAKNKKDNKRFFKDFKAELKKVIWPTPKQLVNNTVAVITIVLITAVIVFVLDFIFERMNTYGINKIKEAVESRNEISNEVVDGNATSEGASSENMPEEDMAEEDMAEEDIEDETEAQETQEDSQESTDAQAQ